MRILSGSKGKIWDNKRFIIFALSTLQVFVGFGLALRVFAKHMPLLIPLSTGRLHGMCAWLEGMEFFAL